MSKLKLVIGNKNYSSWSLRPWVFMKQNNISFDEEKVLLFVDTTEQQLAQYNSDYKVPVLLDGDFQVWDTLAIMEYLSETRLYSSGWPADTKARSFARSVSSEMHSSFMHVRNELPMNCRKQFKGRSFSKQAQREIARIMDLWCQCRSQYGAGGEWLFGDYSIADAMFAPVALRFYGYQVVLDDVAREYVDSVLKQPCINEWMEAGRQETEVIAEDEVEAQTV